VEASHEWEASLVNRTARGSGCPVCTQRWTLTAIRSFVASLKDHLSFFTPAELYVLFQQNGLLVTQGKGRTFARALTTGRFPQEEVEKFVEGKPSLVDEFFGNPSQTLEVWETSDESTFDDPTNEIIGSSATEEFEAEGDLSSDADHLVSEVTEEDGWEPPVVETKKTLAALDHVVISTADEEAVEFLLASAVEKVWKHAFRDKDAGVVEAEDFEGSEYAERVKERFLDEYRRAKELEIPQGYDFRIGNEPTQPNLMQRLVAVRVRDGKRVGNWSGTGAGKTLSAVLSTRVVGSGLTVICCPNSVVDGWKDEILRIFPHSVVATKTFEPDWAKSAGDETGLGASAAGETPRYLVLNYEAFQQQDSADRVREFVERELIDFVVVDEIHYAKQRSFENMSRRRQLVAALVSLATERNSDLRVMGMSATPVINNLQEGKSLIELVAGVRHDDLDTQATIPNCMSLYQRLVRLGTRWMPEYDLGYEQLEVEVDCGEYVDQIRSLGKTGTPLALEQILTRARLPVIREHVRPKTLIYTHYVQGIDRLLRDALEEDGWKVGFYTGEDKSGLKGFLEGHIDVLIGSSAIGTGG
jgi:hypothetical protein